MKKFALVCLFIFTLPIGVMGLLTGLPQLVAESPQGAFKQEVVYPYVEVSSPQGIGSGVCIKVGDETLILTCAHISELARQTDEEGMTIQRPLKISRKVSPKVEGEADVVFEGAWNGGIDLALLKPRSLKGLTPCKWDGGLSLELGESIWHIGTPRGVHARLEKSLIQTINDVLPESKGAFFGLGGCAWHGSSGGPVFVSREAQGRTEYFLAGIISRGDSGIKGICYAVDHKTIKAFLEKYKNNGRKHQQPEDSSPEGIGCSKEGKGP